MDIPTILGLSPREQKLLRTAKKYPPVTKKTLSELDLPCIMNNINLRMDANFDRDLHFKPDLDGVKGQQKRKEAADYWDAMAVEISIYAFCAAQGLELRGTNCDRDDLDHGQTFRPRLPSMFETLQDVLKTLVSERDHASVMQNLEVPLLMQQIRKGVLDMVGLARWLAALLKTHCAPMRDEWADQMVEQISQGSRSQDSKEIVKGLQTLFAILEAMKLDVANHQIRAFRLLLIEDTIPFLQEYFRHKIENNFDVGPSKQWYLELHSMNKDTTQSTDGFGPVAVMFKGLIDLLLQFHAPESFPETFIFDSERLWQLRSNLQNLINLDICWYIFELYIHDQKRYLSNPTRTYSTFRSRIWTLMEESDDYHGMPWLQNVRSLSLEIARFACAACGPDPVVPDEVIARIEAMLERHLSDEFGLFRVLQLSLHEKLVARTYAWARRYMNMSPLAICESQRQPRFPHAPQPQPQTQNQNQSPFQSPSPLAGSQRQEDIERIAMRLAHIGVLHWRVWAPILYASEASLSFSQIDEDAGDG